MKDLGIVTPFFGILVKNQYHRLRLQPTRCDFDMFYGILCFLGLDFGRDPLPQIKRQSVYPGGPSQGGRATVGKFSAFEGRGGGARPQGGPSLQMGPARGS